MSSLYMYYLEIENMSLSSYRNTSGNLGEWGCCGNTSFRQEFPQLIFQVLPNFHKCFYNSIETRRTCFLFLGNFDYQSVNSLCSGFIMSTPHASCVFPLSYACRNQPISTHIFLGLISKLIYCVKKMRVVANLRLGFALSDTK